MQFAKIAFAVGALAAFTACSKEGTGAGTGTPTGGPCGDPLINKFDVPACSNNVWTYSLQTACYAGEAFVNIQQTGSTSPWDEIGHAMTSMELGADTETWGLTLGVVDTPAEVVIGSTSLFQCDDEVSGRSNTLTWSFEVFNLDFELSDCVAYGDDPTFFSGCADGNAW